MNTYTLFIWGIFWLLVSARIAFAIHFKINFTEELFKFSGNTPLHTAVHATFRNIANMLVQAGANERKKNLSGLTPFQLG